LEALVAMTEEKQGADVILTPLAGDRGIDVIVVRDREIRLVQCKHTQWGASVDADTVYELLEAFDGYRARQLRSASSGRVLRAVLSTNGTLTKRARQLADQKGVQFGEGSELKRTLLNTPCSAGEVEAMEQRRLASMPDVQAVINRFLQGWQSR
jgi:HJR/Mrr/RecB family endonuclease